MKKHLLSLTAGVLVVCTLSAQQVIRNADGSYYKQCVKFKISEPLWKIAKEHPSIHQFATPKEAADAASPSRMHHGKTNPANYNPDPVRQTSDGTMQNAGTIKSFDGIAGQGYVPLDPNGMIGSNYYVQTINSSFAVWNKTGTAKLAQTDLANLFGSFTCDDGDPVTMYDKFADRWIITEFQENGACGGFSNLIDTMMFAVSVTNDPTGSYYLYYFCPDNTDFADYPKYTIWADGYYETCNCQNDKVTVYERAKMLKGDMTAGLIVVPFNNSPVAAGCSGGFYCPMMLYADGTLPPYGSPNYLFDFTDPAWGTCWSTNAIRIFKVAVDWTTKSGTLSLSQTLTTATFTSLFSGRNSIDQPGAANYASLDALDGFFSYRIPYMRWTNYNAAVMCNVVNVGTNPTSKSAVAGIRWYELRQDTTTKQWSIYQQGTYAPNDNVSRWNPAIAMDQNGSIGLEYTASDPSTVYPSLRFTGRAACDTLGKMTLAEGVGALGNKVASTSNRWGDYSHLSVDPIDGITFWGTGMYATSKAPFSSAVISHIFSYQIPKCTVGIQGITPIEAELKVYQSGSMLTVIGTKLPQGNNIYVEVFDINGKKITGKNVMPVSNELKTTIDVSSMATGIYFVRIANDNFQRVVKVAIN